MQFFAKVKEINEANKMKTVTKGAPPRVRGKRLPADIVEVTQRFKKAPSRLLVCRVDAAPDASMP
jgi:hypothetical protein